MKSTEMNGLAVITGAAGGLGKSLAIECASRGWPVFLTDMNEEKLETLAAGIRRQYPIRIYTYVADISDIKQRDLLWQEIDQCSEKLGMLLNVAGLDFEGPLKEIEETNLATIIRVNIEALVDHTRRAFARFQPGNKLRVLNVSSLASFQPMPVKATYAASKRFILDFSIAVGQELRKEGLTVTVLCPSGMPTTWENVENIASQGILGRISSNHTSFVARLAIHHALRGRRVVIPGLFNRSLRFISSLIPRNMLAVLILGRWTKTRQRLAANNSVTG